MFYFHPYLGKWSNLTNIFPMGWNHQPVIFFQLVKSVLYFERARRCCLLFSFRSFCLTALYILYLASLFVKTTSVKHDRWKGNSCQRYLTGWNPWGAFWLEMASHAQALGGCWDWERHGRLWHVAQLQVTCKCYLPGNDHISHRKGPSRTIIDSKGPGG